MSNQPRLSPPQSGIAGNWPGSYALSLKVFTPIINGGEKLKFQLFITGYGKIESAKFYCNPSDAVFNTDRSFIYSDIRFEKGFYWGKRTQRFGIEGTLIEFLGGVQMKHWEKGTQFFDISQGMSGCPPIMTEVSTKYKKEESRAPLTFELQTLTKVKPGKYTLDLIFTYFNGEKWNSQTKTIEFKVQNFLERYQQVIGKVALTGSIVGILIGFYRIWEVIYDWIRTGNFYEISK